MSSQIIHVAENYSQNNSGNVVVNTPFIASLYIVIGLIFLVDSLRALLKSPRAIVAEISLIFLFSFIGLVMSNLSQAKGTRNKSKFVAIFACMMSAALFYVTGIVSLLIGSDSDLDELDLVFELLQGDVVLVMMPAGPPPVIRQPVGPPPMRRQQHHVVVRGTGTRSFVYVTLISFAVKYLLALISGIILLTFSRSRGEIYKSCPQLPLPAKLMIAIPIIVLSIMGGIALFIPSLRLIQIYHFTSIASVTLISLGISLGFVLEFINYKKRNHHNEMEEKEKMIVAKINNNSF